MKSGIEEDLAGFDLVVDGANRSFSDTEDGALEIALELKRRNRDRRVEIRMRLSGATREMMENGRLK
ncbi:hypothetical protein [Rhodoplanes sp. Z2-YC6860]|uniref:hypothetical protein n=1 Tax=Rhodoplanes sp. Z2-YC6860 TaxID=674703 RepID=UPI0012ECF5A6|nr:hypothetical protein [Rhodoplanes sp. Z2-YC6860]